MWESVSLASQLVVVGVLHEAWCEEKLRLVGGGRCPILGSLCVGLGEAGWADQARDGRRARHGPGRQGLVPAQPDTGPLRLRQGPRLDPPALSAGRGADRNARHAARRRAPDDRAEANQRERIVAWPGANADRFVARSELTAVLSHIRREGERVSFEVRPKWRRRTEQAFPTLLCTLNLEPLSRSTSHHS